MLDTDAAFFRRRAKFLGPDDATLPLHAADLGDADPDTRDAASGATIGRRMDAADPLEQAATGLVRNSLESQALTMQLPLARADMDRMLSAAQHLMRALPRHQLASLSPTSSLVQSLTAASFSIGMTADAQQRAMRLAHEQGAIASKSAALAEQARTGGQVPLGYQRPGGRSADGSGNLSGSDSGSSSARFASMGGERVTVEVARQMQLASHEAVRSGIPWAVSKPELLKLGPAAVKAVADVQIREPAYQRLTTQAHFAAKDVVTLSTFAKVKGITDANPLAHATADVVQIGASTPEQVKIKTAITNYMSASTAAAAKPDDPAAKAALEAAGMQQRATLAPIAASSAENYQKVQSYEDKAKVEQRFRATAASKELQADATATNATVAVARDTAAGQQLTQQTVRTDIKTSEWASAFGLSASAPPRPPNAPAPTPTIPQATGTKAAEALPVTTAAPVQVAEVKQPATSALPPATHPSDPAAKPSPVQIAEAKSAPSPQSTPSATKLAEAPAVQQAGAKPAAPTPPVQPAVTSTKAAPTAQPAPSQAPVQQAEAKPAPAKAAPAAPKLA